MALTVKFGKVNKKRLSVSVPTISGTETQALLKDDTSIVRPTFRIHVNQLGMSSAVELFTYNYCYCSEFNRYYWITNIVQETTAVFLISCETDVLATWYDDIVETNAFVQFSASHSNSMLPDSRLPKSDSSKMNTIITDMDLCPDEDGVFIVSAASADANGNTGVVQMYAMTSGEMSALAARLYSPDFIEKIADTVLNPTEALVSCMWLPISYAYAVNGSGAIRFNDIVLGNGSYAKKTYSSSFTVTPYVPYHTTHRDENGNTVMNWSDYRNCEPYTEYHLWLPGVGLTQIPMVTLIGTGESAPQFKVEYDISISTGQITYYINRINDSQVQAGELGSCVLTISGNLGMSIPVASFQNGLVSGLLSGLSAMAGMAVSVIQPMSAPYMFGTTLSSGANAILQVGQSAMNASGAVGGWASNQNAMNTCACITKYYEISDTPSHAEESLGLPLFKKMKIGWLRGLAVLQNANVDAGKRTNASPTLEEHNMLDTLLNGGVIYIE